MAMIMTAFPLLCIYLEVKVKPTTFHTGINGQINKYFDILNNLYYI